VACCPIQSFGWTVSTVSVQSSHTTPERIIRLTSQLKWRLQEGNSEALYEIGVDDNGYPRGLSNEDLEKSIGTLREIACPLNVEVSVVLRRKGESGKIAEVDKVRCFFSEDKSGRFYQKFHKIAPVVQVFIDKVGLL